MNSRRIYRNALSQDEIYEEILKNKGTQFDPEIADIFLTLLTENQIPDLDDFSESSSISNLADDHRTISKFISDVVITIKDRNMPRTTTCSPHFRCEISVSA